MKSVSVTVMLILGIIFGMILGACGAQPVLAQQDSPIKIWPENRNDIYQTLKVIDDDTGVNYIVAAAYSRGTGYAVSIVPRLNADGTLYVSGK